jgi:hypothetical protein
MPEMNESGRNVIWATGIACSALRTRLATARPRAASAAEPSSSVTAAAGRFAA